MSTSPGRAPLRFEPIFQYRLWGGRRLAHLMDVSLPGKDPIGEAWVLSDRDDFPSLVADGPLKGKTITEVIRSAPNEILGRFASTHARFPLLIKFLDAREMLSVQVHPREEQKDLLPPGEHGKTEAWVVMESDPGSRIYAGLKKNTTADDLRHLSAKSADLHLASLTPEVGETVLVEAGTVHALGGGVAVCEIQQNSDVTFRLFDWDRVDEKTGKTRELHIEKALECIDLAQGAIEPVKAVTEEQHPDLRERLCSCQYFTIRRLTGLSITGIGAQNEPRVMIVLEGTGQLVYGAETCPFSKGQVFLLPAGLGEAQLQPLSHMTILEVALPG